MANMIRTERGPREIETEVCSRCCGTGHHSRCEMWGTICFKCRGAGKVYTKRGTAAKQYLEQLRSKRADQVVAGDLIWVDSCFSKPHFERVEKVELKTAAEKYAEGHRSYANGVELPLTDTLTIFCAHTVLAGGIALDAQLRRGCSAEEKAATLKQALDYQDTLTKQGTPRKQLQKDSHLTKAETPARASAREARTDEAKRC